MLNCNSNFGGECNCGCHRNRDIRHIMPCCSFCNFCSKRIKLGWLYTHERGCGLAYLDLYKPLMAHMTDSILKGVSTEQMQKFFMSPRNCAMAVNAMKFCIEHENSSIIIEDNEIFVVLDENGNKVSFGKLEDVDEETKA